MSTTYAIAAITGLLKQAIENAKPSDITCTVSSRPLDILNTDGISDPYINLFLYSVTPNSALRNMPFPGFDQSGNSRLQPVNLSLDLRYLLTVYSGNEYEPEILLGHSMLALERKVILFGENNLVTLNITGYDEITAKLNTALSQLEKITVTLDPISIDDMFKIWPAFQIGYRTSVGYKVSVAILEDATGVTPSPAVSQRKIVFRSSGYLHDHITGPCRLHWE